MKSLYKLLFICILAVIAVSAGNFALNPIDEQHRNVRLIRSPYESRNRNEELESLYKYQKAQELPDLRVYDRMSPSLRKAIDEMEKQMYDK